MSNALRAEGREGRRIPLLASGTERGGIAEGSESIQNDAHLRGIGQRIDLAVAFDCFFDVELRLRFVILYDMI